MDLYVLINNIEDMYGDYKRNPGMRLAIEKELEGCSEENINKLWELVKQQHSKSYPPTWYEIAAIADRGRISIVKQKFSSVYVCGNCFTEFTIEEGKCPNPKCDTKGFNIPITCPYCFRKGVTTKFDDSAGVKLVCPVCKNIRTYATIRRKVC